MKNKNKFIGSIFYKNDAKDNSQTRVKMIADSLDDFYLKVKGIFKDSLQKIRLDRAVFFSTDDSKNKSNFSFFANLDDDLKPINLSLENEKQRVPVIFSVFAETYEKAEDYLKKNCKISQYIPGHTTLFPENDNDQLYAHNIFQKDYNPQFNKLFSLRIINNKIDALSTLEEAKEIFKRDDLIHYGIDILDSNKIWKKGKFIFTISSEDVYSFSTSDSFSIKNILADSKDVAVDFFLKNNPKKNNTAYVISVIENTEDVNYPEGVYFSDF